MSHDPALMVLNDHIGKTVVVALSTSALGTMLQMRGILRHASPAAQHANVAADLGYEAAGDEDDYAEDVGVYWVGESDYGGFDLSMASGIEVHDGFVSFDLAPDVTLLITWLTGEEES